MLWAVLRPYVNNEMGRGRGRHRIPTLGLHIHVHTWYLHLAHIYVAILTCTLIHICMHITYIHTQKITLRM